VISFLTATIVIIAACIQAYMSLFPKKQHWSHIHFSGTKCFITAHCHVSLRVITVLLLFPIARVTLPPTSNISLAVATSLHNTLESFVWGFHSCRLVNCRVG
jgi:hypothetical protein